MGCPGVNQVAYWLRSAGYRVDRGFPGKNMPRIDWPAIAVSLYSSDSTAGTKTICAEVCVPTENGGETCEDLADDVAVLLAGYGAACVQEACRYETWGNFFCVRILATWKEFTAPEPGFQVFIGLLSLSHITSFSARQLFDVDRIGAMGENGTAATVSKAGPWELTLVEDFPPGESGGVDATSTFTLTLTRNQESEVYGGCGWTEICREETVSGMRQTRKAVASERSVN